MAPNDREETTDLIARLAADPSRFDFFRAVRLLEALHPGSPRLGESLSPAQDLIRLLQQPSLLFARSTLDEFQPGDAEHPHKLSVNFLGLFGPNAPLPLHITEYARERQMNAHDSTMTAFLNVFHHRMLSLRILTFFGHWLRLPEHSTCLLGDSPETGTLGSSAVIGSRVWDSQLKFRIRIGPVSLADLQRLLPGQASFRRLKAWVLNYDGQEHLWDVQVILRKEEVPEICLGQAGALGWTSWLHSKPFEHDAEDLVLDPEIH